MSYVLPYFEGKENVTCIAREGGANAYLTPYLPFVQEMNSLGGKRIVIVETETKHVLFLTDDTREKEIKRYYLCKPLHGKSSEEVENMIDELFYYEVWDQNAKAWVPAVTNKKILPTKVTEEKKGEVKEKPAAQYYNWERYVYSKTEEDLEKERHIQEYGTADKKKIEKIKEERKKSRKAKIWVILLIIFVPWFLAGLIQRCTGSNLNPFDSDGGVEWQYEHTDRMK